MNKYTNIQIYLLLCFGKRYVYRFFLHTLRCSFFICASSILCAVAYFQRRIYKKLIISNTEFYSGIYPI